MIHTERFNLEFKREISKTFLKTVSAFANYNDGQIVFGVDDNGISVGIKSPEQEKLRIEQMINTSIDPVPKYSLQVDDDSGRSLIILTVSKGRDTPYLFNQKAYKRSDTSTVEVSRTELVRLSLAGINLDYEKKEASTQDLDFSILELRLQEKIGISKLNLDIMKTLGLYNNDGFYNVAAELLADENSIEFSGVDIIRFGHDSSAFLHRETIKRKSLLVQYERAIELFEQYYTYETVKGFERIKEELVPPEAFREALANAIVHRVWDTNQHIQISMFDEKIVINSPGGLPEGVSLDNYLYGNSSVPRNPLIAGVFYKLDIIEKFGTGIRQEYDESIVQPHFTVGIDNIVIELPVLDTNMLNLSDDEHAIINILKNKKEYSRIKLDELTGFNKSKTLRALNDLMEKDLVVSHGKARGTTYKLNIET